MYKATNLISAVTSILMMTCFSNVAFAAPVMVNLQDNFLYADPESAVTFSDGGYTAELEEDFFSFSVVLSNDPFFGDPNVVDPEMYDTLTFDYDFVEPLPDNENTFHAILFDTNLPFMTDYFLEEFYIDETSMGSYTFDNLSAYAGRTLGLQFELQASPLDFGFDSTVTISNLRLDTVSAPIPEPSTVSLLFLGCLLLPFMRRQFR